MTYTYSLKYLRRNDTIVRKLMELYDRQGVVEIDMEDQSEALNMRRTIRNVLACLAYYYPQHMSMKQAIRTWVQLMPGGKWRLFVGVPDTTVRGSKPYDQAFRSAVDPSSTEAMLERSNRSTWIAPKELTDVHDGTWFVQTMNSLHDKDKAEVISSMSIEDEPMRTLLRGLSGWKITQEPYRMGQYRITAQRTDEPDEIDPAIAESLRLLEKYKTNRS
jgi:hypothetical protein